MKTGITPFKAISDSTRRSILDALREEHLTAGAIAQRFQRISRPAVSKHLTILRRARLVAAKKHGRELIYSLHATPLRPVADWLRDYEVMWDGQLQALKDHVEAERGQSQNES